MPTSPIVLVGLKTDLRTNMSVLEELDNKNIEIVTFDEGRVLAAELGLQRYVECSPLTRKGIDELVQDSIEIVLHPREETKKKKCNIM